MGFVFKQVETPAQALAAKLERVIVRLKELWQEHLQTSGSDIAAIIEGTFINSGLSGDGEKNGIPTQTDIENIIAGAFVSYEPPVDDFAIADVPTQEDIENIIAGAFDGAEYVPEVPAVETINAIINGTYSTGIE